MKKQSLQTCTRDRTRISFDLYSLPDHDNLLVICPGFFQSKETAIFQRMAAELAEDQDVLCMDFRGHGCSGGWTTLGLPTRRC